VVVVVNGGANLLTELITTGFSEVVNVDGVGTTKDCVDEIELEAGARIGAASSSAVSMQ
jgi:hypothetical protein